jgi:hypothetical protein
MGRTTSCRALACTSRPGGTSSGIVDEKAGEKKASAVP